LTADATGHADVIVIGGGLVGTAIACGLVRNGLKTLILDEGDLAFRASRGNFGLVWVQSKGLGMPAYARWSRLSSDLWPQFAEALSAEAELDVQYEKPGGFHLCLDENEFQQRAGAMQQLADSGVGFTFDMVRRRELLSTFPEIGPEVVGASYSPYDGHANSLRLFRALHIAFAKRGGRYQPNNTVEAIEGAPGSFTVTTNNGRFSSAKLVIAAGNGSRRLAPMVGLEAPVSPERGQVLVTAKVKPFLPGPTAMLRQTGEGSVLIGDSKEDTAFDDRTSPTIMRMLARRAVKSFPVLEKINVVRSWGALRIMSPDGFPIYQQSETCPGAFVACLHSGVTLAAAHEGPMADAITTGALPASFEPFRAERFHVRAAA
jgi:glycine/D-amino acid oxidase-like deaminating enzyme